MKTSKEVNRLLNRLRYLLRIRDIKPDKLASAAGRTDSLNGLKAVRFIGVGGHHRSPFGGKPDGHSLADARSGAGDDCDPALKLHANLRSGHTTLKTPAGVCQYSYKHIGIGYKKPTNECWNCPASVALKSQRRNGSTKICSIVRD